MYVCFIGLSARIACPEYVRRFHILMPSIGIVSELSEIDDWRLTLGI